MTPLFLTLTDSRDFQNIARNAKRWSGSCFTLQARKTAPDQPLRFGLTASRKVGNAVMRNRAKRRFREILRAAAKQQAATGAPLSGYDLVIIARTCACTADFAALQADFARGLQHLGLVAT